MTARVLVLVLVLVLTSDAGTALVQPDRALITVSAAISLSDALNEIGGEYAKAGGGEIRFNFAASNVLARQIINGAPVDVFVSADQAQMDLAERAGAIAAGSRRKLLTNRLVIVMAPGVPPVSDPRGLLESRLTRVAVGDPTAVPAGVYAKAYLQHHGVWDAIQGKLVPLANVRAALEAVRTRAAPAAIVYESDAAASASVQLAYVFPEIPSLPIEYPVALTARSPRRSAAERFVRFLQGAEARRIFERFKFRVASN
jgi:molybdate transport system substrate-binding protein